MSINDILKILFIFLKAGKEQFFGNINIATLIKNNRASTFFFVISCGLFGLIAILTMQTLENHKAMAIYQSRLKTLQDHFATIVPEGTADEDIAKAINQKLFRQNIEYQRCRDELDMAKQMLLIIPTVVPPSVQTENANRIRSP